jgi:hypothetical protein
VNIIGRSFLFFVAAGFAVPLLTNMQPGAESAFANEAAKLPGSAFRTPRAAETGTPGPMVPKAPEGPQAPKGPNSSAGSDGLFGPRGVNSPQGLNGPQGPVRR